MFDAWHALLFLVTCALVVWHSYLMLQVPKPDSPGWDERLFAAVVALLGAAFLIGPAFGILVLAICVFGVWRPAAFGILGAYNPFANATECWGDFVRGYLAQWWTAALGVFVILLSAPQYPWVLLAFGIFDVASPVLRVVSHDDNVGTESQANYLSTILVLSGFALIFSSLWVLAVIATACYGFVFFVRLRWARESGPDSTTA